MKKLWKTVKEVQQNHDSVSNLNLKKTIYGSSESYECIHSYMYNRIRHKRLFWLYKLKLYIKLLILESI